MATEVFSNKKLTDFISGNTKGKTGTKKNPVTVQVKDEKRAEELKEVFMKHGWEYDIQIDPDKDEDIAELDRLLNPPKPITVEKKLGPNEPCHCGSGKKLKKCCKS